MPTASDTLQTVGIECESLEGDHGGVARLTRKLIQQLSSRDDLEGRYHFILYFKRAVPADLRYLDSVVFTTRVFGVPSFSLYYYLFLPLRLWWDRPTFMFWPNYMLPLIHPPFVRSLVMLTDDIYRESRNNKLPFRYRLAYRIFATGWTAHRADRILAISESSRRSLMGEGVAGQRIVVNHLGVDVPERVEPDSGEYLLVVGQAFPRRHLRETLEAFARIAPDRPDLRLEVIGVDKYDPPFFADAMADLNRRLDRPAVSWRQHVSDDELASAYAGAQAVVYVSDAEAFGLPPLEALAFGTPAIVADVPVTREIYGPHAFYVRDTTSEAIAEAMTRSLEDATHRDEIRRVAPEIVSRFTWRAFTNRFIHHLDQW